MNSIKFPEKFVNGIVTHINEDHRAEMLLVAHGLMDQTWATGAMILDLDKTGFRLQLENSSKQEVVTYTFETQLEKTTDWRPTLISLVGQARENLGLPAPTSEDRH